MIEKCYAKVNIFLKIVGTRDSYHELASRFCRVHDLYDLMFFEKTNSRKTFTIIGDFSCDVNSNTVYKIYNIIKDYPGVEEFFKEHVVRVEKNIPEFAGLGGGSSNAATFLLMANKYCNLNLSKDEMSKIGEKVGADVPFFIYEYDSANVTGIGEIVEKYDEEPLNLEVFTPKVKCDTGKIFTKFREKYYKIPTKVEVNKLLNMKSIDILNSFDYKYLNDLYLPACDVNKDLEKYSKDGFYFSGSGSSFFKVKDKN